MNQYPIDIKLLHEALNYFSSLGYEYLSAPLLVDLDVVSHTLPNGNKAKQHIDDLYYVGSAEQSILQLIKDGYDWIKQKLSGGDSSYLYRKQYGGQGVNQPAQFGGAPLNSFSASESGSP